MRSTRSREFSKDNSINAEKILKIAKELIAVSEIINPPINLEMLASFRDIKYKPSQSAIKRQISLPGLEQFKPSEELRVKYGFGFESLGFIPKNKSINEDGRIILSAFKERILKIGRENIDFGTFKTKCNVQALPLRYLDGVKILTLLSI